MLSVDLNAISDLLDKALDLDASAREPARCYATVGEFAADLRSWIGRRPITARAEEVQIFIANILSETKPKSVRGLSREAKLYIRLANH